VFPLELSSQTMDNTSLARFICGLWDREIVPSLTDYIRIPNKSPMFDPAWEEHGHMNKAVALFESWAHAKLADLPGATLEVVRVEGRTPLIFIEVPGKSDGTLLLYGHLDKQPEMTGWAQGMGPWTPVLKDDMLYGRGGADDGYAMFAAISALLALAEQNVDHARCVITIEAGEESGSPDLPFYLEHLASRIGTPDLIICLDSGCGNYDQLWLTTSLRGVAAGRLSVRVLTEGVHSGDASGIVPSSFRILRMLLVPLPEERLEQARTAAQILGNEVYTKLPFTASTRPMAATTVEMILNRSWKPQLAVIGMEGYPLPEQAGNVLLPYSLAKLSLRTPPTCDAQAAVRALKRVLEADPPYGAEVAFEAEAGQTGWNAPSPPLWLQTALNKASETHFGKPVAYIGEGGSIPFMAMLGKKFPKTQFVVTGVLGPHSNAHGPNEFLHIPTAKKVSACIANVLADHARRS
jgi:acetylornithine deacetylase/succinyl-diaminopimelate desuccinylase-like protein